MATFGIQIAKSFDGILSLAFWESPGLSTQPLEAEILSFEASLEVVLDMFVMSTGQTGSAV